MATWTIHNPRATFAARPSMATNVYFRFGWNDPWTWLPEAWCTNLVDAVAPGASSATVQFDFGVILPAGQTAAVEFPPANLLGAYVLIEGVNAYGRWPLWVGIVQHEETHAWGNTVPTGTQQFLAVGLDQVLDRVEVRGAYTSTGQIDRVLQFNRSEGFGVEVAPNMAVDNDGWPVFGPDGDYWTYRAIVDYVLHWYLPDSVAWELGNPEFLDALGYCGPRNFDGYTLRQVLDDLFDRKRGLGWCVRVDAVRNVAGIHVFSDLAEPLMIGNVTIPANPAQTDVYYEGNRDADPVYRFSDVVRYDAVQVFGGRVYTTLTFTESILPKVTEQAQVEATGEDVRVTRLASYALHPSWDWFSPWGDNAAPGVNWEGTLLAGELPPVFNSEVAFERQLPFLDDRGEPRPPFALVWLDSKWQFSERAKAQEVSQSLGLNLADRTVGFTFTGADTESGASTLPASTNWLLTATLPTDRRLAVRVAIGSPATIERVRTLEIPEAIAHWVCPQTVLDVDSVGGLIRYQGDQVYRSDVATLRNAAALAVAWYGRRRATLDVRVNGITFEYLPGSLIRESKTGWFSVPVQTVVTERTYDFVAQTTTVRTSYDELMVTQVIG